MAASDKGQKINIQCNWLFSERIKKTHVAQLITAGATFAFCARLEFVLPASDTVSGLLHSPLSFNRIEFADAYLELTCKPATYPARTQETL